MDLVWRKRDIVIAFFLTTVLVVTVGSLIMRPVYRATVTLLIDSESPNVLTTTGLVEIQSANYFSYKEYYQSQVEILKSGSLMQKVFDEFSLGKKRQYAGEKEPIKKFSKTIKIEIIRDTRLVKLNVDNRDPQLAAGITNRMAELFVMRNLYYISKSEILNLLKNEYLKLESKESEYAKIYKDGHPEMIKLKKEMTGMIERIRNEKKSVYNYDDIEEYLGDSGQHALAGFKANNISIQDHAAVPAVPVRPKKLLNFAISIILGLIGGVGLVFLFEYLDDGVKSAEDIEKIAKWPFLGSVPVISEDGMSELQKDIFVSLRPKDPVAEVYKFIRTRILFASTEEHPLKNIMMTSPGPQEGKTLTLCNLAIAMAQNNKSVLMVDADMRKPRLNEVFGMDNSNGLSSFLSGQAEFDKVVQKTGIENIHLITGGVIPPNPSELLASHKVADLVTRARAKFDFVLFDTPPVGILADAVLISRVADGVIVTMESGKTSKRALGRIHQMLIETKAHIIGVVLNKVAVTSDNAYYYARYYGKNNTPLKSRSVSMSGSFFSDMIAKKAEKQFSAFSNNLSSILKKYRSKKQ